MVRVSARMILILFVLIFTLILNAASVIFLMWNVSDDTQIINSIGIMRGEMQRAVKLELAGKSSTEVIKQIDDLSDSFIKYHYQISLLKNEEKNFRNSQLGLRSRWNDLKEIILLYRNSPTNDLNLKEKMLSTSEDIWIQANRSAGEAVSLSVQNVKYFYILLFIIIINILLVLMIFLYTKNMVRDRLEFQAHHDPLTGIYNRNALQEVMEKEMEESGRYERPLFLMLLDLDFFKKVNDRFGHDTGDHVLKAVTAAIKTNIRKSDVLARIGGEEFVVLYPQTGLEKAIEFAEKIRKLVEKLKLKKAGSITVSIGLTQYRAGESIEAFLKKSDIALYRAKKNGRNRVEVEIER